MQQQTEREQELELLKTTARMKAKLFGLVLGFLFGFAVFAATNWLIIRGPHPNEAGQPVIGPHLALLGQYFIGYRVTFLGSLVGFFYAFVIGSATGWLIAVVYNGVSGFRD
jgi:hypothetical protein